MTKREELKQKLADLEKIRMNGLSKHGVGFYDHQIYAEILAQMEEVRAELMKAEPSKDKEYSTKW